MNIEEVCKGFADEKEIVSESGVRYKMADNVPREINYLNKASWISPDEMQAKWKVVRRVE